MDWKRGRVLDGDVDVAELAFERIRGVDRVGARCMEQQIDRVDRLMNGVWNGQPRLRDLR